jgi:YggT family protein
MTYGDPTTETIRERERVTVERPVAVVSEPVVPATSTVDTIRRIVWLAFGVLQSLIVLRIVLLVLGANLENDIVAFIVGVTDPFVEPFRSMFRFDEVSGASGAVLDLAALVALLAWTLVEALVLGIVGLADRRRTTTV